MVLKDTGVAVIEVPYVKDLIDKREFDTIYHEHLCYFSLTALAHLFARHDLVIHDVERIAIHGGSLRLFVGKRGASSSRVTVLLAEEQAWGVGRAEFYQSFGQRVERLRTSLVELLHRLKSEGRRIVVYGASAKGSTLLNYFRIGPDMIDFVVDRNTFKQGRYTPGTHLKIHVAGKTGRRQARLRVVAELELCRRNPGPAGRLSPRRRAVHHPDPRVESRLSKTKG